MENMLKEALLKIKGPFNQLLTNLSGDDGELWLEEFKKFLRKEQAWDFEKGLSFSEESILIQSSRTRFLVEDKFTFKPGLVDGVWINSVGAEIRRFFFNPKYTPQRQIGKAYILSKISSIAIIDLMNSQNQKSWLLTFRDIWALMKLQPRGEPGFLDTRGHANLFYVQDRGGSVWVVNLVFGDGWRIFPGLQNWEWHTPSVVIYGIDPISLKPS